MTSNTEVLQYIESISYFTKDDENCVSTRDNGDVGSETAGKADIEEAKRILKKAREKFPEFSFRGSIVDEWVDISWQKKGIVS